MKFIYIKNNLVSVSPDINYYNDVDIYITDMYDWLLKYKKLTPREYLYFKGGCRYIYYNLKLNENNMDLSSISKNCASKVIKYIKYITSLTPSEYENLTGETVYNINASNVISYKLIIQIGKSLYKSIFNLY